MKKLIKHNKKINNELKKVSRGVYQIFPGWWGQQPGKTAVVGVLTDHSFKMKATIISTPLLIK